MPTIRENAVATGLRANRRISGQLVTLTRGVSSRVSNAVKQSSSLETLDSGNRESVVREARWRIAATDYLTGVPEVGDTVTEASGTVWVVECPGDGVPCWEYTDTGMSEITVFSRMTDSHQSNLQNTIDLSGQDVRV